MTSGTEQQFAVFGTEGRIVSIGSHGVRTGFLLAERYVKMDAVLVLISGKYTLNQLLEQSFMFRTYGEMDLCLALRTGIQSRLNQMLFQRSTRSRGIFMELEKSFGQLAVIKALVLEHIADYSLVLAFGNELIHSLAFILAARIVQVVKEGKTVDILEVGFFKGRSGLVVRSVEEFEHILEHTAGRTACRHKLGNDMTLVLVLVPSLQIIVYIMTGRNHNIRSDGRSTLEFQIRETRLETLQLIKQLLFCYSFLL